MPATTTSYADPDGTPRAVAALTGERRWVGEVGFVLARGDQDGDGRDDWTQDGAGAAFRAALAAWSAVANVTFAEVRGAADANLVERTGALAGDLATHEQPGARGGAQSHGTFDAGEASWSADGLVPGGYGFLTMLHETGHALGLRDADAGGFPGVGRPGDLGASDLNQSVFTVMSYSDGWALRGVNADPAVGWQATPGAFDIAAVQAIYGANTDHRTGDDVYALPTDRFVTVWDAGGADVIAHDGAQDVVIVLAAATLGTGAAGGGVVSHVTGGAGGLTVANGVAIEGARGGAGDDLVAGGRGAERVEGGVGDDVLLGLGGADTIDGGAGDDLIIGGTDTELLRVPDAAWLGGITFGSGRFAADADSDNGAIGDAIDLSGLFHTTPDAAVHGGGLVPHVTVEGTGGGAIDVFAVTLANPFATLTVDVDGASFDSAVAIADASGRVRAFGDDAGTGQGGSGSTGTDDTFLRFQPGAPGTYYVVVGEGADLNGVGRGETYTFHLSIEDEVGTGRFGAYADDLGDANGGAPDGGDLLVGGEGADVIHGGAGDDVLYGDGFG